MKTNRSHCPLNYALEIFGDKWTLLIIRDIVVSKKKTFGEFSKSPENIATNILANRLQILEKNGILSKQVSPENNKVYLYYLTPKGLDLLPTMLEMVVWGAKYDSETAASAALIERIHNDRSGVIRELSANLTPPQA